MLVAACLAVVGLAALEIALRRTGILSIPLFASDSVTGYRPCPSQQGQFRRRNRWRYDSRGTRTDLDIASLAGCDVIVGDSVVDGGLHVPQEATLAARVAVATGHPTYPVACPGWALGNELAALRSMPGWRDARRLVFVLNTGDFDVRGVGSDTYSFPPRYPILALPWLVLRQAARRFPSLLGRSNEIADPACRSNNLDQFRSMASQFHGEILIVRFPMKDQDLTNEPYYDALAATSPNARIVDVAGTPGWSGDCYIDHIHPNSDGLGVLCECIAAKLV